VYPVQIPAADIHYHDLFEPFLLGAFAKFRKTTVSFVVAVRVFAWYSLDGFSWNLEFMCFSNTGEENSDSNKMWREYWALYMKTNIDFWSYLIPFFLEWEMFQTKVVEKIKTLFFVKTLFFPENLSVCEAMWKIS